MNQVGTQGVTVDLPAGFEGRAVRRTPGPPTVGAQRAPTAPSGASVPEKTLAIVHAATVPLPAEIGDFGSNVVDILGSDDVFLAVFEYDPTAVNTALFAEQGVPHALDFEAFSPTLLQRGIRGQSGAQRFFTEANRAFCLYVVLGSDARRAALVDKVNTILATLSIDPVAPVGGAGPGQQPPSSVTTTTVPLGSVADVVAAQADLTAFTDLLDSTGLRTRIAVSGPFTVFAPSDPAFAAFDLGALRADQARLERTVEYHVVAGEFHVDALHPGQQLPTLAGPSVTIGMSNAVVTVDDAALVRPDLDANNGVVHVIGRVLEPPA